MHPFKGYIFKLLYITFSISSSLEITNSQTISIYTPNPYIQVVPVIRKLKKIYIKKKHHILWQITKCAKFLI